MASIQPSTEGPALLQVADAVRRLHEKRRPSVLPAQSDRRSNSLPSPPTTPSARTGPPRSFSYLLDAIPPSSYKGKGKLVENGSIIHAEPAIKEEEPHSADMFRAEFVRSDSGFRGPFEYESPEKDQEDETGTDRPSWFGVDTWNPKKWLGASGSDTPLPGEGKSTAPQESSAATGTGDPTPGPSSTVQNPLHRSSSTPPHISRADSLSRWKRLKSLLPHARHLAAVPSKSAASQEVNITDELAVGGLAALTLRMWFDSDEHGYRRVPILLHRLKIRVSDSLHPLQGSRSVFRIECEYADGGCRWVVYRQLRDFISLHTHYTVANYYNRNIDTLPPFPRTSLPYFNRLKKESRTKGSTLGRPEFAKIQREGLENYLIGLIRAVMFVPSANRLCRFLEISAFTIALAPSGSPQLKGGLLKVHASSSSKTGFGRRALSWAEKRKTRWCTVSGSYLVVSEEQGETSVYDVFLLDSDFKIERPERYYRKGLRVMHLDNGDDNGVSQHQHKHHSESASGVKAPQSDAMSGRRSHRTISSITSGIVSMFQSIRRRKAASVGDRSRRASTSSSSSSTSSSSVGRIPPIIDPSTNTNPLEDHTEVNTPGHELLSVNELSGAQVDQIKKKKRMKDTSKHTFFIENSQSRLKLEARSERQMLQWIAALERMAATSHWSGKNRFESFAPIRLNVAAQWLVDGRDYFWNLSRAILLARDTIYIHGWWLSPELFLRRPGKQPYRIDHLLQRKAEEGVKIYIIIYKEVSNRTTPTDSNHAKTHLTGLHPNIMMQRSPSHYPSGTFYWAHHEKMCVVDEAIAFMGGIDMCFGRWDTPQHVLIDDADPLDGESSQIWPGKDYSNPRVSDFHTLNKPDEDMYDRSKTPRMPWHDVGLQVVGQPARDLCRHFVQRWNYLLRVKNHSRRMPFLIPPPEFRPADLEAQQLTGTCEMQICRSIGPWSMGTTQKIEHSIQNAYLKAIQLSDHFVYIENQFFITSTVAADVEVENKIGDALVSRIIRAHREGTKWKACILIPLLPGFTFPVDHADASAIRIILECQNRTIARGPHSIFGRLRKEGIDPDEYITFFSLRGWGKLPGDSLTTEQVYIHAKIMIVDDRLAIIGSANINERSQRGDRDSELAAVLRDTDMIDGTMDGKPYKVGRFAHTLRVCLMREHLGVDVDAIYEQDLMANEPAKPEHDVQAWDPDEGNQDSSEESITKVENRKERTAHVKTAIGQLSVGAQEAASTAIHQLMDKIGVKGNEIDALPDDSTLEQERRMIGRDGEEKTGFPSSVVPTLEEKTVLENRPANPEGDERPILDELERDPRKSSAKLDKVPEQLRVTDGSGELFAAPASAAESSRSDDRPPDQKNNKDDVNSEEKAAVGVRSVLRQHLSSKVGTSPWTVPTLAPTIDPHGFDDPISDNFFKDVWVAAAVHNTEVYRKVFHAIPDDLVTTWKQYKDFVTHHERLQRTGKDAPAEPVGLVPSDGIVHKNTPGEPGQRHSSETTTASREKLQDGQGTPSVAAHSDKEKAKRPTTTEPFEEWEREEMEKLLRGVRGHLVVYPTRFLEGEDISNNFLFNADRLFPIMIYN